MLTAIAGFFLAAIILTAFLFGWRAGMTALILIRPICDRLFELGRFEVAGSAISGGALINVVIITAVLSNAGTVWRRVPNGLKTTWLPFLLVSAIAVLYAPAPIAGLRKFLTYVSFASIFMMTFTLVKCEKDARYYTKLIVFSSIIPVAYGLFQLATGIDWFQDARIHSTFSHPNIFAFYLVTIIGSILCLLSPKGASLGRFRHFLIIYLVPILVLLVMTKTRGAWVGCLILFLFYGAVYNRSALIAVSLAPVLALAVPTIKNRVADLAKQNDYIGGPAVNVNSLAWRRILWEGAFTYIADRPLAGFGLDSFPFYSTQFFPLERTRGTFAHNVYVQFLFEEGAIGLISFVWIFFSCCGWLMRNSRYGQRGVGIAGAIMMVHVVAGYSDNLFEYLSFEWCFWLLLGITFAECSGGRVTSVRRTAMLPPRLRAAGVSRPSEDQHQGHPPRHRESRNARE